MAESFVLFALVALLAIGIGIFVWWRGEQRRKELAALAQEMGWQFDPQRHRLEEELRDFEATSLGRRRSRMNELRGEYKDRQVRCFDYWCKVQQGKHESTQKRGVALVRVPSSWPPLRVVPEHIGHKLVGAVGVDDVDFESQAFSDRFWVRSPQPKFAYDVITPRMMEHLMETGLDRWEIRNGWLCLWSNRTYAPAEIVPTLDRAMALLDRIPPYVWAQAEARP